MTPTPELPELLAEEIREAIRDHILSEFASPGAQLIERDIQYIAKRAVEFVLHSDRVQLSPSTSIVLDEVEAMDVMDKGESVGELFVKMKIDVEQPNHNYLLTSSPDDPDGAVMLMPQDKVYIRKGDQK